MIEKAIIQLCDQENLTSEQAYQSVRDIMAGKASEAQIAAFLVGLRCKGETAGEISGGAKALTDVATTIHPKVAICVDPVGTGGDHSQTFNISSAAALLASAAGAHVAKHGNRSVSSRSGSADVFEALGFDLACPPDKARRSIEENRFAFLFAPQYHPAMRHAAPVRRQLKIRTLFNLLGPLANPAAAKATVLGVYSAHLLDFMAEALRNLNRQHALVVHSRDGLDEISLAAPTDVRELRDGKITSYHISPEDFGFQRCNPQDLAGGDAIENATIIRDLFAGRHGPRRDITLLNAAATVYVAGLVSDLKEGVDRCAETIDSGQAQRHLQRLLSAQSQFDSKAVIV